MNTQISKNLFYPIRNFKFFCIREWYFQIAAFNMVMEAIVLNPDARELADKFF